MEPNVRRTKKMAKKSALNTRKTAVQAGKKIPAVPVSNSTSSRDEEEQVDYEPETPPSISPAEDDFSEPQIRLRSPMPGEADDSDPDDRFYEIPAEDAVMAGRKRRRIFQQLTNKDNVDKDELAAPSRKGGKTIISAKADDDSVATLPGVISGGSSPSLTKTSWQPLQEGVVSPSFLLRRTIVWQPYQVTLGREISPLILMGEG
jgi:hypothetical protein